MARISLMIHTLKISLMKYYFPPNFTTHPVGCLMISYGKTLYLFTRGNRIEIPTEFVCLKMATEKDLVNAVRDSLESGGELGRIKAEMRTEVMKLLDGSSSSNRVKRPEPPRDVVILNELIREYLDWVGYKYTLNVLIAEGEVGKQPLDRTFLLQDLKLQETEETQKLPLLFSLVETFRSLNKSQNNVN